MPLQSRTNVSQPQAYFELWQNRLEFCYLSLTNMHTICSDQNVQDATELLGLTGGNRPNWEVPKLYDTYFVIRLLLLDGINYFPCHHSSMTHFSCVTIMINEIFPLTKKLLESWQMLRKEDCVDCCLLSSIYFFSQRIQIQNLTWNHSFIH
jgi:hypothetical protein